MSVQGLRCGVCADLIKSGKTLPKELIKNVLRGMSKQATAQKFQPPKCPSCEAPLDVVWETVFESYHFNPESETYSNPDPWGGSIEITCPNCEADVADVFPEGACNTSSGKDG